MKKKSIFPFATLVMLTLCGCQAPHKYYLLGHSDAVRAEPARGGIRTNDFPTITLMLGERVQATRIGGFRLPFVFTGYWLSMDTHDHSIARPVPLNGSFYQGTDLVGVAPGRTRAVYGNAAVLAHPDSDIWTDGFRGSFWVEVLPDYLKELNGAWVQADDGKVDFATAEFSDGSVHIQYRENSGDELREISFPIDRIGERIYSSENDVGMRWLISSEGGEDFLHLEVPSEEYRRREIRLIRSR